MRLLPSLRHIQISWLPLRVDSKAILLPSGEYCGPLSIAVEDRNRSAGIDECFESSCFLQMLKVASLAGIREAVAPDRWFRSFLAKLQSLRLATAQNSAITAVLRHMTIAREQARKQAATVGGGYCVL
jgi:hypothetical protein